MKLTKSLLKKSNITKTHFANVVGLAPMTVTRYLNKENICDKTRIIIETGAKILKEEEFVWPNINYMFTPSGKASYKKNKKKSDSLDKKFTTAFNKAMKVKLKTVKD